MFVCEEKYDVIVIGGGHAGCEAALASAKLGAKTLLLTQSLDTVAQMSCNPSIGGIAKGQIVREIDALGGAMGRVTDHAALHYHMLNTGKGPAVHSPRVQCDKKVYQFTFKHFLELQPNLEIMQDEAVKIATTDGRVSGVVTLRNTFYHAKAVVLTTGTFLAGTIHIGTDMFRGGRYNDMPSDGLAKNLREELGLHILRFKTGTPMRINARGLDYSKFRLQPSDDPLQPISHFTDVNEQKKRKFLSCYITRTTLETDKILRENFHRSAMYSGNIHGLGPRYCPSVEDKIKKFPDVTSHPLFLEPEGFNTEEYYIQGFSTSMPEEVQRALIKSVPGMERATITRPGYAIEYDFSDPMDLFPHLESKLVPGLFMGGQINGTTGYEEAGGQGLMAGINAALQTQGKDPFILRRDEAYIGVLIDDLVNKGVNEPYRMFTSRAEYRILLRNDNADLRLTPHALRLGMLGEEYKKPFEAYQALTQKLIENPQADVQDDPAMFPWTLEKARTHADIHNKYAGYYERNKKDAEKLAEADNIKIPEGFDPSSVRGILFETSQKLREIKPQTLGQAGRIPGVTPADIQLLAVHIERFRRIQRAKQAD
ncbi:MAG: tRNA uridine-5-carboxymethylaminomethyl(34) synthesis enzyme MnmG [Elusimicrobiaceae bacterium]|nr:tRNA uridine-5-carboxymethylaminomethyl(34) synthesis enzyme MnmG [Elusimicrobiaceae bacterium]MBP3514069.1 tRNA uridine-5-carboxymethylaminomethyl(34) synthesis enzyme MnmG [Elusimicrobiaceae bacterium]